MYSLQDRVALVTGAAQGIGRACAIELARAGATVALADLNQPKQEEVVAAITAAGGKAACYPLNVVEEEAVKATIKAVVAAHGKLEILVNNAGITRDNLLMRMKRSEWDSVLATNLTAAFLVSQAAVPTMLKQRWGRIINIASVNGQMGAPGQANYAASKAGIIGLTMSIAREVASRGITCNAIAPGFIETAMTAELSAELKQAMLDQIPLGRTGKDIDVANAVCFLASEEAGYVTGHVLKVNGGLLMG